MADKDLYGVLGVSRDAETNEIRKAFLKLSKVHHPDKGGRGHGEVQGDSGSP